MSRPSRRVRQRLAKKFTVSSETAIASEQARKERQASARLARILVPRSVSVKPKPKFLYRAGQVVANRDYKAPKGTFVGEAEAFQLDSKQYLYRGKGSSGSGLAVSVAKLTNSNGMLSPDNLSQNSHNAIGLFDGQIRVMANRNLSGKRRKRSAIERLLLAAALEATFSITHVEGEEKHAWITDTGFKVIRSFDCEPILLGSDRSRSIRAQNSGSGKPKRKLKPKPWYHSKDRPEPDFRLIQKTAKGKVFQEIGAPGGRILRERTPKK